MTSTDDLDIQRQLKRMNQNRENFFRRNDRVTWWQFEWPRICLHYRSSTVHARIPQALASDFEIVPQSTVRADRMKGKVGLISHMKTPVLSVCLKFRRLNHAPPSRTKESSSDWRIRWGLWRLDPREWRPRFLLKEKVSLGRSFI